MAERNATLGSTIQALLEEKKYSTIKDVLITMEPADVAGILEEIGDARISKIFRLLPKEQAAETFAELEPELQELLIRGFSDAELHDIIEELYVDDAVDLVEEMPANVVKRILSQANPDTRKEINDLLRYPENSAGSIMTTEYVSLRPAMTVRDAINRIRSTGVDKETIYTCYVTENRKLLGQVSVKDMILCEDESTPVSRIMDENVISVSTLTDQEEVAQMLSKYNFLALPVIDTDGHMVGIVTFDDAMDVMVEETTEDIEKMAAILPSDKTYLRSNAWDLFRHRIPWLALLMVSATFTGMIITGFEDALMDTGGNSGSQASVSIIRALSLGELEFADLPKVVWKEIQTAVLCGCALALLCFGKIMLVDKLIMGADVNLLTAAVVCCTMAVTVLIAKIVGCTLPMGAQKLGLDPAVMASPFITTIVDALSLLVYFGIAKALLF